jgi:hypothetical protein
LFIGRFLDRKILTSLEFCKKEVKNAQHSYEDEKAENESDCQ